MNIRRLATLVVGILAFGYVALAGEVKIAASAEDARPLAVGTAAPSLELVDADGRTANLGAEFAAKPTILVFYRGSWCPFCNRQLAALGELEPQLLELGYQILAISPDESAGLKKMSGTNHLNYRLLSDRAMRASSTYGVAFQVAPAMEQKYQEFGVALPAIPDRPGHWLPVPSVFIVGRDGTIKFVYSNPDYRVRLANADLLAAAKAQAAH